MLNAGELWKGRVDVDKTTVSGLSCFVVESDMDCFLPRDRYHGGACGRKCDVHPKY